MELTNKKSKIIWGILIGILCLVILLSVFQLGSMTGFRKARFACQWGERYGAMIGMPLHAPGQGQGSMMEWPRRGVPDAHGANGTVISVSGQGLVVKEADGIEKTILVSTSTKIRKGNVDAKISDIAPEDRVVIMGRPDDSGEMEAGFIRVFDHKLIP